MLCRELARGVGERGGGATYAKRACWPSTMRNGTFSFEPPVASVGTGRKCAFGATIGISVKLEPIPRENAQTRSKRDPEHSRWQHVKRVAVLVLRREARARRGEGVLLPAEGGRAASLEQDIVNHLRGREKMCQKQILSAPTCKTLFGAQNSTISLSEAWACPQSRCPPHE